MKNIQAVFIDRDGTIGGTGHVVGAIKILVKTGWGASSLSDYRHKWQEAEPDYIAEHINDAVEWILNGRIYSN